MLEMLAIIYTVFFAILAWRNFRFALYASIITLPSYLIRLNFFGLPSTLLELEFGALLLVWLVRFAKTDLPALGAIIKEHKIFFIALDIFLLSSVAAIFISDMWWFSFGQWRAYILEPVIFFIILLARRHEFKPLDYARALPLAGLSVALLALLQSRTGLWYPPSLWDDITQGRATAFFTSPNAVGLFLGPALMLAIALILTYRKTKWSPWAVLLGLILLLGILSSQSVGALIASIIGVVTFGVWSVKKCVSGLAALGLIFILVAAAAVPPVRQIAALKTRSLSNRLILWNYSYQFLTESPKNFIFGAGIRQFFRKIQKPYYNPKDLERLIYPHNFFLNFWTETGLFGMLAISFIFGYVLWQLGRRLKQTPSWLAAGFFSALVVVLAHGLIDVPYFKNDLALVFWALLTGALAVCLPASSTRS